MGKFASVFLFLLCFSSLNAQFSFGVSAGFLYSKTFYPKFSSEIRNGLPTTDYIPNVMIGFFSDYSRGKSVLSSGLNLSKRGTKLLPGSEFSRLPSKLQALNFYFIEIPIVYRYQLLNNRIEIGAGLVNSILFETDFNVASKQGKPWQLDVKGLVRWNLKKRHSVEAGYLYGGLNQIYKEEAFYFGNKVFSLSYLYQLK